MTSEDRISLFGIAAKAIEYLPASEQEVEARLLLRHIHSELGTKTVQIPLSTVLADGGLVANVMKAHLAGSRSGEIR